MSFHLTGWEDYQNTYIEDLYHLQSKYNPLMSNNFSKSRVNMHTKIFQKNKLLCKSKYRVLIPRDQKNLLNKLSEKNTQILSINLKQNRHSKKDIMSRSEMEKKFRNIKQNQYQNSYKLKKQRQDQILQRKNLFNIVDKSDHTFQKIDFKRLPSPSRYQNLGNTDFFKQTSIKKEKNSPILVGFKKKYLKQIKVVNPIKTNSQKNANFQSQQQKQKVHYGNFRTKIHKSVSDFSYQVVKTLPQKYLKNQQMFVQ